MPGDVFRSKSGLVWFVVDEFVSVLRSGEERIGFRVVTDRDGSRKTAYVYVGYLRRMLTSAAVMKQSRRKRLNLRDAPRVHHVEDHVVLDSAFSTRPGGKILQKL